MATTTTSVLMRKLQRAALLPDGAGLTDGQLLERFLSSQDEVAFEMLVLSAWLEVEFNTEKIAWLINEGVNV